MTDRRFEQALLQCPVIAIIRDRAAARNLVEVIEALIDGGIRAVEVTADTQGLTISKPGLRRGLSPPGSGTARDWISRRDRFAESPSCGSVRATRQTTEGTALSDRSYTGDGGPVAGPLQRNRLRGR
ncbi:MAG: hypothetical protein ABI894_03345 [Ilumatobacteraceae bacterium]